jgi:putative iron-dependent peroxidase
VALCSWLAVRQVVRPFTRFTRAVDALEPASTQALTLAEQGPLEVRQAQEKECAKRCFGLPQLAHRRRCRRPKRHDVNFSVAQAAMQAFGDSIEVQEEVHGFRWVEERDLSGFVDGTENPAGEEIRRDVAVIKDGIDAGGSYVFVQRWEHNLKQLNRMSVHDQEMMIGRTKQANEEIDGDDRPVTSHLTRVDLKEDGKGLKIVRQSLPYGTASGTHGLYFCAYCARLYNIEQQLLSMFGDTDGKRDAMLRFTKPVTGGYYFAPSVERLLAL